MLPSSWHSVLLLSSIVSPGLAAHYDRASQLPQSSFDYIIIGAGAAGAVLANRLTEDPNTTVLLLEAGVSNTGDYALSAPLLGPTLLPNTIFDWNYTTIALPGLKNRSIPYPRGRVLGGSTSVNYMEYIRGASDDWDRYAAIIGDPGWSWDNLQPYIRKNEKFVASADLHNTTGQYNPAVHSTSGLVDVSLPGYPTVIDPLVIKTTQELSEFPFQLDMNSGYELGIGWVQAMIGNGERSSSATAYLGPQFITRTNLHVLTNAHVTKVVHTGTEKGIPSFRAVEYTESPGAPIQQVKAHNEVLLSAGSINTPQLLMLSGIGDKQVLSSLGIPTLVDLPSVGKNMSDHPRLCNVYNVSSNETFDDLRRGGAVLKAQVAQWNATKQGELADTVANNMGWLRLPSNNSIFKKYSDWASGPNAPHWEIIFCNFFNLPGYSTPATGSYMSILTNVAEPVSRGSVTINSTDPFAPPVIDPGFFTSYIDVEVMREAIKAVKRLVAAPAWRDYVIGPYGQLANATTDAEIEDYARENTATVWHPTGSCSMSPKGAEWGVVDPDFRVKGAGGLRVIDTSILPFVPAGHTTAPTYFVAERAADLIKTGR